jgi:hypothetical protein
MQTGKIREKMRAAEKKNNKRRRWLEANVLDMKRHFK